MPKRPTITLEFKPALDDAKGRKELRDGLSGALRIGRSLWVANDESASVERLTLAGAKAADHVQFPLRDVPTCRSTQATRPRRSTSRAWTRRTATCGWWARTA